jgi:dihydroflavonol-4-reductase
MTSNQRVLVTGATGFIGSHLTRRLLEEGHEVWVLSRQPIQNPLFPELKKVHRVCIGDITNPESLQPAVAGVQTIFHLAGFIAYKKADREKMELINVQGTKNLLSAAEKAGVEKFVYMSSVVTIGAGFSPTEILHEDSIYNLEHLHLGYSETKLAAEKAVMKSPLYNVILNPSTVYGAGDALKGSRKTQVKVAQGKFKIYPPGGANIIAVEDVIEGTLRAWQKGRRAERYILAHENLLIKEIFEKIARAAGVKAPFLPLPRGFLLALGALGDGLRKVGLKTSLSLETAQVACLYHWFSSAKAQKELGLSFKSADFAIENSVRWLSDQGRI